MSLSDTNTTTLGVGSYRYWLSVTKSSATRTWLAGLLTVMETGWGGTSSSSASLSIMTGSATVSITSIAELASAVSVVDSGNYFVGTNVETVLAELAPRLVAAPTAATPFTNMLNQRVEPVVLSLMGDSTGDVSTEWFELLVAWLATQYPTHNVHLARWSDSAQRFSNPELVQAGTEGASYVALTGAVNDKLTTPDTATVSVTGDIAMWADVSLTNWTPASNNQTLCSKFGAAGQRSWRFYVEQTTGLLVLAWYPDGTTAKTVKSTVAPTVADGARRQVGVYLDVDNGSGTHAVTFYTRANSNAAWTTLGTGNQAAAGGGTTSIFDSTTVLAFGARTDSSADNLAGNFYGGAIHSGTLNDGIVAGCLPALFAPSGTFTFYGLAGEVWTSAASIGMSGGQSIFVLQCSVQGKDIAYFSNATRFGLMTPTPIHLAMFSLGHNETTNVIDSSWRTMVAQMTTKYNQCAIVAVTQNPEYSPRTALQIGRQGQNQASILRSAQVLGYSVIDAYRAFLAGGGSALVDTDGVHPIAAGSTVWADTAKAFFKPWL